MKNKKHNSSGAAPDAERNYNLNFFDEEEEGDIEHDEKAFERFLKRESAGQTGSLPGFAPAGIKGSDSDLEVMQKWQAFLDSPKGAEHKSLPPKRVLMALFRQDGGDQALAAAGLTPDLIAEFNRGHLTKQVLLAFFYGPKPFTPEECATWPKLSLSMVFRMEADELHTSENGVTKRKTYVPVYVFDIENEPDECMLAALANNQLFVPWDGSFKVREWWMNGDPYGLEIPKLNIAMVAKEVIERNRQLDYECEQMWDFIRAYNSQKGQDEP